MSADKIRIPGRQFKVLDVGPTDKQVVQFGTAVDRVGGFDDERAREEWHWLERFSNVVEDELRGTVEEILVDVGVEGYCIQDVFTSGSDQIEGTEHVKGLVVVDQGAYVDRGHFVLRDM